MQKPKNARIRNWIGGVGCPSEARQGNDGGSVRFRLQLGVLLAPAGLVVCPSAYAGEPTPAKPSSDPSLWVVPNDYPSVAMRNDVSGKVRFILTVSREGVVTGCDVTQSSGSAELDSQTCTLLTRRGRFHPAQDDKGRPVTGTYASSVNWVLPKTVVAPPAGVLEISFVIGEDGETSDCKVVRAEGAANGTTTVHPGPCEELKLKDFQPYLDQDGVPTAKRVTMLYSTIVEAP